MCFTQVHQNTNSNLNVQSFKRILAKESPFSFNVYLVWNKTFYFTLDGIVFRELLSKK